MSDRATRDTDHHTALDDRERTLSQDRRTEKNQVHAGEPLASSAKRQEASEAGVHPIVVKTAIAAALWFIAVVWLAFAGPEISYLLVIVTLFFVMFFVMFFVLFLLTAFYSVEDPRWSARRTYANSSTARSVSPAAR
jgi:fatty acid desaturase